MPKPADRKYRCPIPATATERVRKMYPDGRKEICDYFVKRRRVGVRFFSEGGVVELEHGIRRGRTHGTHSEWDSEGRLMFRETYVNGRAHGIAKQWSRIAGKLIGKFRMNHGTGIDLWWNDGPGRFYLSEIRYMRNGLLHGREWWLDGSEKSVWSERWWRNGHKHGIERQWNSKGKLDKGFPKYFLSDKQVSRSQYLKAAVQDPSLPPYQAEDNKSKRIFPSEIQPHLRKTSGV